MRTTQIINKDDMGVCVEGLNSVEKTKAVSSDSQMLLKLLHELVTITIIINTISAIITIVNSIITIIPAISALKIPKRKIKHIQDY